MSPHCYDCILRFIETSREVSSLEAEMYHLSHLLHENESLTQSLGKVTILESFTDQDENVSSSNERRSLASILETVEGSSSVTAVPGRYLVYSGPLTELDPESSEDIQDMYAFLLNDSLMLTTLNKKRKGPIRYKYHTLMELDNMAVLSVLDTDFRKNTFRILLFPVSRTFRAASGAAKSQWIHQLTSTKQQHKLSLTAPKKAEESVKQKKESLPVFEHHRETKKAGETGEGANAEWVKNVPENLDVFLAQREFEKAVDLVEKTRGFLKDCSDSHAHRDIRAKLGNRIIVLCDLLMKELEASPNGSLRGGPRAARKAIDNLLRLGRAAQACELFLKNHSSLIRHESKQIRLEGTTSLYISKLSKVFFEALGNAAVEFERAFTTNHGSYSAFVIWCMEELKEYCETFCEIVFKHSTTSLSTVAECIVAACGACETLESQGLSLKYALMNHLKAPLALALKDATSEVIRACTGKATAEKWEPMDFRYNSAQISALVLEMENMGIMDFKNLVIAGGIIDLSETTVQFCRLACNYVTDVLKFYIPELYEPFIGNFCVFSLHIVKVYQDALSKEQFLASHDFIQRNTTFTINTVIPSIGLKIEKLLEIHIPEIVDLIQELQLSMQKFEESLKAAPVADDDIV